MANQDIQAIKAVNCANEKASEASPKVGASALYLADCKRVEQPRVGIL